ncbi:MAG: nucleotide exchange factor GrpE [Bdellovibrionales bacterium]|nr:nucleotide exchange factor GrpE [Bdellovibrionales bacterium]
MSDDTGAATEGANGETAQNPLEMELAKAKKDYLYLYAEFENYKKNAIKERADLRKFGPERLVVDLLNVLDIFDTALAIEQTPENMASIRKGFEMTALELKNTLERHGVQEMPGLGAPFDPNTHEALSSEETAEFPEGHVARVFKKPYRLHERLVRPGQVVVAKGKN